MVVEHTFTSGNFYINEIEESENIINIEDESDVLISLYSNTNQENRKIIINLGKNSKAMLEIIDTADIQNDKININQKSNSELKINHFLNIKQNRIMSIINNNAADSYLDLNHAIIAKANIDQQTLINLDYQNNFINHRVHGLSYNDSKCKVSSIFNINSGSANASCQQNLKAISFQNSSWQMIPDLNVSHNELQASHGACIGMINDIYYEYASSRGLSKDLFEKLYCYGFLLNAFTNPSENMLTYIEDEINKLYV